MNIQENGMSLPNKRLGKPPRVVVVDDDVYFRSVVAKAIEQAQGQIVGEAADGNEALRLCQSLQPEWVFTDYEMPGLNGLELVECLRVEGIASKVAVISHSLNKQLENHFEKLQVEYFFHKRGFAINAFIRCLKRELFRLNG